MAFLRLLGGNLRAGRTWPQERHLVPRGATNPLPRPVGSRWPNGCKSLGNGKNCMRWQLLWKQVQCCMSWGLSQAARRVLLARRQYSTARSAAAVQAALRVTAAEVMMLLSVARLLVRYRAHPQRAQTFCRQHSTSLALVSAYLAAVALRTLLPGYGCLQVVLPVYVCWASV